MSSKLANSSEHLTSGHLLARNTLWNLLGNAAPMAVAVFSMPILIRSLGKERFGVLSLAWIVIGYFSLFDLGVGRALTKLVADKIGKGEESDVPPLAWTALFLMLGLGGLGGLVLLAISPWLVHSALKVPPDLQTETLHSFFTLSLSIPVVILTSGLRGILEAKQRFRTLNLIRIPMSIFSFAGPLLVLPFSHSLFWVIVVLVVGRIAGCAVHQIVCFQALPSLSHHFSLDRGRIPPLLRFGGWMMVSNIVGPIIFYIDRFFIGAALSLSAVAYYTVPFDLVNRFMFIPGAISAVLFPAFAMSMARDPNRTALLLNRGVKYTFVAIFPITLAVFVLAPDILRIWLGASFADHGSFALRWLALGILINSVTVIPFSLLEGVGHPDLTGKILLLETVFYAGTVWLVIRRWGIDGAAIAWVCRAGFEAIMFFGYSYRYLPKRSVSIRQFGVGIATIIPTLYIASCLSGLVAKVLFLITAFLLFLTFVWRYLLTPAEKSYATRKLPLDVSDPVAATL